MWRSILSGDTFIEIREKRRRKKCMYIVCALIIIVAMLMCTVASFKS